MVRSVTVFELRGLGKEQVSKRKGWECRGRLGTYYIISDDELALVLLLAVAVAAVNLKNRHITCPGSCNLGHNSLP